MQVLMACFCAEPYIPINLCPIRVIVCFAAEGGPVIEK